MVRVLWIQSSSCHFRLFSSRLLPRIQRWSNTSVLSFHFGKTTCHCVGHLSKLVLECVQFPLQQPILLLKSMHYHFQIFPVIVNKQQLFLEVLDLLLCQNKRLLCLKCNIVSSPLKMLTILQVFNQDRVGFLQFQFLLIKVFQMLTTFLDLFSELDYFL